MNLQSTSKKYFLILLVPLALSAFTHIWNPVGFPAIYDDEDTYIKRAIIVVEGLGPKDPDYPYDHPYFGQLFLAAVFKLIGYPNSVLLNPSSVSSSSFLSPTNNVQNSIQMLYLVPRVSMGILAVIDTFLVYKIGERRYNRNVALIASILFAVMPMSWFIRRILLDSIQLPLLLTSILFASHNTKDSSTVVSLNSNKDKRIATILLSGIFMGLAIFTKIPAFTMIPLVGFLIYEKKNNNKSLKSLGFWLIPVILIPLIWPFYAASIGQFNQWVDGVNHQTHRENDPTLTLFYSINSLFKIDPVLMLIGTIGIVFSAIIKRDILFLLWVAPYLIFLYFVGFVVSFHMIPLLPPFCIAAATLITNLSNTISNRNAKKIIKKYTRNRLGINDCIKEIFFRLLFPRLPFTIFSIIGIFGLISITMLITANLNSSYFKLYSFIVRYIAGYNNDNDYKNNLTMVGDHRYFWIPKYVFHKDYNYEDFESTDLIRSKRLLLIIDEASEKWLSTNILQTGFPMGGFKRNTEVYNLANKYPYTSLSENYFYHYGPPITSEIRTNVLQLNSSASVIQTNNGTVAKVNDRLNSVISTNQSGSLPLYWNDFLRNCVHIFGCTINSTTGWQNIRTSFQLSTNTTNKSTWSSIYGKEINVKPDEQYQLVTHMKLNSYATQSHIAIEGYDQTSKKWNQITQCPTGTNGPLDWHGYSCEITIPKDTSMIRPVLNAGWSSQPGKQAVTLFDAIYLSKTFMNKLNRILNPNFVQHFDNYPRIANLCQFRGDFDIQVSYELHKLPLQKGVELSLIAHCSRL